MLIRLDHVVHSVPDLGLAIAEGARFQLTFRPGGRHPKFNSANALLYSGLTYWELLAFEDPPPHDSPAFVRRAHECLVTGGPELTAIGFSSDDLEADLSALRHAGFHLTQAAVGTRTTPDGTQLRWQTADFLGWPEEAGAPPFLIQHGGADEERRAQLAKWGFEGVHGPSGLTELVWPVPNPAAAADLYHKLLDTTGAPQPPTPGPGGDQLHRPEHAVHIGTLTIRFVPKQHPTQILLAGALPGELLGVELLETESSP